MAHWGFARHTSLTLAKPKEPLFSQRLDNISYIAQLNLND